MINLARNKASDERWERDRTYFSAVTDAPIETTIYSKINKWSKSDWAYFSAMNDDPNEATINLERNKGSNESFKSYWNYPSTMNFESNLIEAIINLERNKGLKERSQSDWTYFSIRRRCFDWDKHLYKDKEGIEWKIEVIKLTFRWSSMFQWIHRSIQRETNDCSKDWREIELTSQSWTMIESNWDSDNSRKKQGIEWDIEGRSSLPLSDDRRIESNGDNNQPREKQGLEWKFVNP